MGTPKMCVLKHVYAISLVEAYPILTKKQANYTYLLSHGSEASENR